jgi:hypothetical protein
VVIPDFLYIYCFPNSSHSLLAAVAREDYEDRRRRQAQGITKAKAAGALPRPAGRYRPQRRHRRYAPLRYVIDGNSSGDRLQPRDDRRGSREGSVSSPVLFFERRAAFGPAFICAGVGFIALHRPTQGTHGAPRNGRLRS